MLVWQWSLRVLATDTPPPITGRLHDQNSEGIRCPDSQNPLMVSL